MTREVRDLEKDITNILAPFEGSFNPSTEPATACNVLVNHLSMRRNKRCLLAYHRVRSDKLEEMCWGGTDVLEQEPQLHQQQGQQGTGATSAGISSDAGNQSSLSPEEEEYFRQYGDLLASYKGRWTDIDLTGSLEPPKDLFIDVRVLKDAGEIQTEYGYVVSFLFIVFDIKKRNTISVILECNAVCHSTHFGLIFVTQGNQLDQEQPILRSTRGRGTAHRSGVFAKTELGYPVHDMKKRAIIESKSNDDIRESS